MRRVSLCFSRSARRLQRPRRGAAAACSMRAKQKWRQSARAPSNHTAVARHARDLRIPRTLYSCRVPQCVAAMTPAAAIALLLIGEYSSPQTLIFV